jgi:hypothetical protein
MQSRLLGSKKKALILLAIVCVLVRLFVWLSFNPIQFADTKEYEGHALCIKTLYASKDSLPRAGDRTPLYPLLILACGFNRGLIWFVQSVMGVAIAFILFGLAYRDTRNVAVSFFVSLWYTLSPNLIYLEPLVLSETLSGFLIILSVLATVRILDAQGFTPGRYVCLGLVVALAGLTRPNLLTIAPIYLALILFQRYAWASGRLQRLKASAGYAIPIVVLMLAWCTCTWRAVGVFAPTTITGYSLSQHSGGFIEYAPDRYATIRDIYVKYRAERTKVGKSHGNVIWEAYREMRDATGLSHAELSRELRNMSIGLFVRHPLLYLKSVFKAWAQFWDAPCLCFLEGLKFKPLIPTFHYLFLAHRCMDILINFSFLAISLYALCALVRRRKLDGWGFRLLLIAIILAESVGQALVEFAENGRYALPFQPLTAYVVMATLWYRFRRGTDDRQSRGDTDSRLGTERPASETSAAG